MTRLNAIFREYTKRDIHVNTEFKYRWKNPRGIDWIGTVAVIVTLEEFFLYIIFLVDAFQNIMIKSAGITLPQIPEIVGVILSLYFTTKNIRLNLLYVALMIISLRSSTVSVDSCVCVCSIRTVYEHGAFILVWTSETLLFPLKWMFFF